MSQQFWIAVKVLLQNQQGDFLVLYKSETEDVSPNSFDIPWGRIHWWESLENAITREVQEEVWLGVQIEKITRTWWFTKWDLYIVWITYLWVSTGEIIQFSDEHTGYYRLSKEEIIDGEFPARLKEEIKSI